MRKILDKRVNIIYFIICFSFFTIVSVIRNQQEIYWDCEYYWNTSNAVFENGIRLLNYPETFRGCLLPLIIGIGKYIFGDTLWIWKVLSALQISVIYAWCLPLFFNLKLTINKRYFARYTVLLFLTNLYWGNFLQFPLSDLPAIFFILCGVCFLKKISEECSLYRKMIYSICGGAFFYASYNTRVAYIYGIVLILIYSFIKFFISFGYKKLIYITVGMYIGCFVVATPQMLINHKYLGNYIPKVYTEQMSGYQKGLGVHQLFWGIQMDRFEGYVGESEDIDIAGYEFEDRSGLRIIQAENIVENQFNLMLYFKLLLKYPIDFIGIYCRHLINCLTPLYLCIYIPAFYIKKSWYILLAIFLWIVLCIHGVYIIKMKKMDLTIIINLFSLLVASFLQMLGAPEMRFFLMGYIISYYILCIKISYGELLSFINSNRAFTFLFMSVCMLMWVTVVGDILSTNTYGTILLDDYFIMR